jgi:hypothetical protein
MTTAMKPCGSCGEPIWWLKNTSTGRMAPIEVKTSERGNCLDNGNGTYTIVRPGPGQHINHFATCPQAAAWHRGRR